MVFRLQRSHLPAPPEGLHLRDEPRVILGGGDGAALRTAFQTHFLQQQRERLEFGAPSVFIPEANK